MHSSRIEVESLRCANCGYALTGNESGRCPECGLGCDPANPMQVWSPRFLTNNKVLHGNLYIMAFGLALMSATIGGVGLIVFAFVSFPLAISIPGLAFGTSVLLPLALHLTPKWLRHGPSLVLLPAITTAAFFGVALGVELGNEAWFVFPAGGAICAGACVFSLIVGMRLRHIPYWYVIVIVGMLLGALFVVPLMVTRSAMTPIFAVFIFVIWHLGVAFTCAWALATSPLQSRASVMQGIDGRNR